MNHATRSRNDVTRVTRKMPMCNRPSVTLACAIAMVLCGVLIHQMLQRYSKTRWRLYHNDRRPWLFILEHKSSVTCNIIQANSTTTRVSSCYSTLKSAVTSVTIARKPACLRSDVTANLRNIRLQRSMGSVVLGSFLYMEINYDLELK